MSRRSWRVSLNRSIQRIKSKNTGLRVAVLGVGNELNGDDAAGLLAIRALQAYPLPAGHFLAIEAGLAPENFTASVIRFSPGGVLVIDAARMGYRPGGVAWLELDEVDGVSAATHGLPLSMLGRYLVEEIGCQFSILGIQIEQTGFDLSPTPTVQRAARRVGRVLGQAFLGESRAS